MVRWGDIDFGTTFNEAKHYAILKALFFVASYCWKYTGDYIHLKSDSALATRFLDRDWKPKADNLVELAEQIRALVC